MRIRGRQVRETDVLGFRTCSCEAVLGRGICMTSLDTVMTHYLPNGQVGVESDQRVDPAEVNPEALHPGEAGR